MPHRAPSLLIVDDDRRFHRATSRFAAMGGWETETAGSLHSAQQAVARRRFDLMMVDPNLPDGNGLDLLAGPGPAGYGQAIVVTGRPSVESAIRALRLPVLDYLIKPVDDEQLRQLLRSTAASFGLPPEAPLGGDACGDLHGASAVMHALFERIRKVAPLDVSVLIHGESGTGKELAAQAIHRLSGRAGPFVAINCGAVAPELLASQLFGHERGSFTGAVRDHRGCFEQAQGGTLFLDELTEMPLGLQAHLLRVLESREVTPVGASRSRPLDVRVLAATNRDPVRAVAQRQLREDVYYRLADFPLAMPPLRERASDIPLLARRFLDDLNRRHGTGLRLCAEAMRELLAYRWPGNVRELRQAVRRAYVLAEDGRLRFDLPRTGSGPFAGHDDDGTLRFAIGASLEEVEKQLLLRTLSHFDNDKPRAAQVLGVSLKTIYNKLARYRPSPH
jgi:DNA-binding NtrC family response regulator